VISSTEKSREYYFRSLRRKTLFSALYGTYTMKLNELQAVLKARHQTGQPKMQGDGFTEVRSRKRQATERLARTMKKAALPTTSVDSKKGRNEVATRNVSAPLRATNMDTDTPVSGFAPPE
jgi:hypothetical protein